MANVAFKPVSSRQYKMIGEAVIDFSNIVDTAVAVVAVKLPTNSVVTGGSIVVDTATNAGTSMTLQVGDSSVANRYLAATSTQATGRTALTPTGYLNTGGLDVSVTPTIVGAVPTAGSIRLYVEYLIEGRGHEAQTN